YFPGCAQNAGSLLLALQTDIAQGLIADDPENAALLFIFEEVIKSEPNAPVLHTPPSVPNAAYSIHLYAPSWDLGAAESGGTWVDTAWKTATMNLGVPMWIGEFNAFGHAENMGSDNPGWSSSLDAMMSYCTEQGISWAFFAYGGSSSLVTKDAMGNDVP